MRKMMQLVGGLALLALAGAAAATECRYSAPRDAQLDAAALRSLLLNLGPTDAHVRGVAGLTKVEVRGTACASNPQWLQDLQLDTSSSGGNAVVTARTDHHGISFGLFGLSRYAYMKLSVRVPAGLAVVIDSGSGDVIAQELASLDFHSGSGDLQADGIAGALVLQVGSGDVTAQRVGEVTLHSTGSGDVTIDGVRGDVHADYAGSGDLDFSNVGGGVWVGSIGSGDLHLGNIADSVHVGSAGSGDVMVDGVGGDLDVGSVGSGDVRDHGVKGAVHVPKRR
jgi:Toastrack DUF4097